MNKLIEKFQTDFDVFSDPLSAKVRSRAIGLEGKIHVYDLDGQAYYVPGATHKEYLEHMEYEDDEEEEVSEDRMTEALRAVVAEIMSKGDFEDWGEAEEITKAEYQGKEVPLNKPRRLSGGNKKFEVFVQDGGKVKRVTFGDPNMEIRRDDDEARANFRARHSCDTAKDKTSARYWSCRMWEKGTTVSEVTKASVGDKVSWNSSGGTARGIIRQIVRDGTVPDIPVKVTGTKEEPAARIEIVDDEGKPTGQMVGHKLSTVSKASNADISGEILKVDNEQRLIYGWASVITEKGEAVVDRQGDVIDADTLTSAVNKFMEHVRVGKTMHTGEETGKVIHSLPITKELCDALGIQSDREGWVVAYKVYDDAVWERVKSGELRAFSIGGRATREEL
jgi:hypothetical protein